MKRKKRNSDKSNINLMLPIKDVLAFGSANDPCFGKHYSPQASECRKCGDNELCVIAMAHKAKARREESAKVESFKDLEDVNIDVLNTLKNIVITNRVEDYKTVCTLVKKKFGFQELKEAKVAIKKAVLSQKKKTFKLIKTNGKKYIRAVKA